MSIEEIKQLLKEIEEQQPEVSIYFDETNSTPTIKTRG